MERNKIFAVLGLVAVFGVILAQKGAFQPAPEAPKAEPETKESGKPAETTPSTSKLIIKDEKVGTGPGAKAGDQLSMHYTGKLTNGDVFDSSKGRDPFTLTLGGGQVIKGWDEGLKGMKKGGKRKLTIPPDMGYGAQGQGSIPGNATLIFDVEMVDLKPAQ